MRVLVLGPLEIESDDPPALSPRDRVVLSALLVRLGGPLSAEDLADALWGEDHPASWLKVVHGCVSRLRRALGVEAIETVPVGYRLRSDAMDLDTVEFEALAHRGREYAGQGSPERAAGLFEQALALWRGRPFDELDEWTPGRLEAGRLGELRLGVQEDLLQARLDGGDHRGVAAAATVAAGEEPWRERRWALLALAQYREGRQADALSSIRRARAALGNDLGLDPGSELVALEHAILTQDTSLAGEHAARSASADCPWKGLSSYAMTDQDAFFGRSAEIAAILTRLDAHPLVVLAGPSGSGKSSLMLAGLAPALRRRGLEVVTFSPGTDPAVAMSTACAATRRDPVLLVDQFEETFTIAGPGVDVTGWLAELATYAASRAPVVVTLRADLVAHLTVEPTFARMAEQGLHLVAPLEGAGLREAIEAPARLAGLRLEQGLVELMMRDTEGQPGALPLLSHALVETWRRREHGLLSVEGYRASGGMRGAVAASAERLYEDLTPGERTLLRRLMLRMVALGDGGDPIRTQLPVSSVTDPARRRVLERLARARLVTTGQDSFELAHEALARAWPRLRSWLDDSVEEQRLVRHLAAAASGWDALGRPDSELYRGARLHAAAEWLSGDDADPTTLEREFVAAAQARAEDAGLEKERQIRLERQQNRRLRVLLVGVVTLLLVAAGIGALALDRGRDAARDRDLAEQASDAAAHEALVGRSLTLRATNRSVAALLAVQAHRSRPDHLSQSALLGTFTASPSFMKYQYLEDGDRLNAAGVPNTPRAVVAGSSGHLGLLSIGTGALTHPFGPPVPRAQDHSVLRVSKDGERVAQLLFTPHDPSRCGSLESVRDHGGKGCSSLVVHDIDTGERVLGPLELPFSGADVAISDYGEMVAVTGGYDGDLATYDVATGRRLARVDGLPRPDDVTLWRDTAAVAFDSGGDVFLGSMSGPVREVDARTGKLRRTFAAPRLSSHVGLVLTPQNVLVAAGDEALVAIDLVSGRRLWVADLREAVFAEPCPFLAVVTDYERIYCGTHLGPIEERDLNTGQLTGVRLDSQLGSVGDLVVSHFDLVGFAAGEAAYTRWRADGSNLVARLRVGAAEAPVGYDPSSTYLVVEDANERPIEGGSSPQIGVMKAETGELIVEVPPADGLAWVGDGSLAYWGREGGGVLDVASGRSIDVATLGAETRSVFADPRGETSWQVDERDGRTVVRELDLPGGPEPAPLIEVAGGVYGVTSTSQGRVLVTHDSDEGVVTTAYDRETAEPRVTGMPGQVVTALSTTGRLVGADDAGDITEFDAETLAPIASLPGARRTPSSLQFDDSGAHMLVTAPDQTVQVYDSVSRTRIGDAIPSSASPGTVEAWLRPDGGAVAVNGPFGLVQWSLDPDVLAAAACELAGRNLTRAEWSTYLGDDREYEATCDGFPAAPEHSDGG